MSHVAAVSVAARVILQLLVRMQKASLPWRTGETANRCCSLHSGTRDMEKPLSSRIELITFPGPVFTPGVASGRGVFHY